MSDKPFGIRFYDQASCRNMLLINDPECPQDGWIAYKHPDGQWVALREATEEDRRVVNAEFRRANACR